VVVPDGTIVKEHLLNDNYAVKCEGS